ncbi:beta-glucosidase [Alloacidobacterium sp.]|uniref:beta-glucosidase n=1 Tax=Alloacidobacterium sp. TaxID=2951999 RepID=UPI002D689892|nr:glycoside hydrolase family 3 C-terminal domain-containing protein [Alloacidobacterium sp.]HYK36922.1 glycoside hydrolase family 3 C-terminal domain-containing protein [Alloacidobacterium sp.]
MRGKLIVLALFLVPGLTLTTISSQAQAPAPDNPAIEQRVDSMLKKLTLEQKLELIGGVDGMFIRSEDAAGFPRLKMSDGPYGVRTWGPDTAYAAGIGLAATWDPELAQRMGVAIGQDARARGVHFLLGPGVNIYRAPMGGRNFEYFGEDPFLSGHIAVPYIEGVQSQGVIATVKHFAANNQEYDRHNVSSDVDERTLREIYLPAFEDAVKVAHVGAVMNSYNLLDGIHATQDCHLNNDILKKDWAFNGILMSDWVATYDGVGAANCGLDLEMPSGAFMNPKNLLPAIKAGKVSEATIDDKVRRIFRTAIRFGFLDRDPTDLSIPFYNQNGCAVALDEARESITLLKNEGNLLPLNRSEVKTIAVLGPDAWPAVVGAGGSSTVEPYASISIMAGLANFPGSMVKVLYARGLPTTKDLFERTHFGTTASMSAGADPFWEDWFGKPSIKVETFDNPNFTGTPTVSQANHIAFWGSGGFTPPSKAKRSIRYTADYLPQTTGQYIFVTVADGGDTYKLLVDGKQVIEQTRHEGQAPQSAKLPLTAGKVVKIQFDYVPEGSQIRAGLGIHSVDDLVPADAKKIASMADVALISVGFDQTTESEGMDRTFGLPWGQDQLIKTISAANKNTIVAITGGGGVDMRAWIDKVPALLHNWYPGQEGGQALAEVIFGTRSPEGHLPASFERAWEDNPTHDNYYAPPTPAGQTPHVKYREGVFVGYRYYTSMNKQPLFPFGFGLSYTTFSFSNLEVSPKAATSDGNITVSFDVTNTGQRAGADVAQLYVGDPSAKIKRPVKELKGFDKVRLEPGEKKHVSLTLDRRALAYWDVKANDWRVDPGQFKVYVGDSSENTPLEEDFTVSQ